MCFHDLALEAANELGLSKRQIYRLIKLLRETDGELTALIKHGSNGGRHSPGQPHFGGIVERVIGTLMTLIHELLGTTFSNPNQRGDYDSDKTSCLTLEELERWLALAITKYYHLKPHIGMDEDIPLHRYEQGIQAMVHVGKTIPMPRDPRAFLIDFLPAIRRSLQRNGIVIDHITYYSDALRP